jgi:hypothetical protein
VHPVFIPFFVCACVLARKKKHNKKTKKKKEKRKRKTDAQSHSTPCRQAGPAPSRNRVVLVVFDIY